MPPGSNMAMMSHTPFLYRLVKICMCDMCDVACTAWFQPYFSRAWPCAAAVTCLAVVPPLSSQAPADASDACSACTC